jgi:hypothetical protein
MYNRCSCIEAEAMTQLLSAFRLQPTRFYVAILHSMCGVPAHPLLIHPLRTCLYHEQRLSFDGWTSAKIQMCRVGQNHIYIYIYGLQTVFLAGKSPNVRSYTVYIYDSGQPYKCVKRPATPISTHLQPHGCIDNN